VHDREELRASLGLCPQFDVLYDEMTAGQQLMLYGCMAGA
jgi:ABC-type multidrug transport system ATPase subunit